MDNMEFTDEISDFLMENNIKGDMNAIYPPKGKLSL
jgi:hypothetical protein